MSMSEERRAAPSVPGLFGFAPATFRGTVT